MKVKVTLSIGLQGTQHDVLEFDDADIEGLTDEEREKWLNEAWQEWAWNYIDGGATIIEEDDES